MSMNSIHVTTIIYQELAYIFCESSICLRYKLKNSGLCNKVVFLPICITFVGIDHIYVKLQKKTSEGWKFQYNVSKISTLKNKKVRWIRHTFCKSYPSTKTIGSDKSSCEEWDELDVSTSQWTDLFDCNLSSVFSNTTLLPLYSSLLCGNDSILQLE